MPVKIDVEHFDPYLGVFSYVAFDYAIERAALLNIGKASGFIDQIFDRVVSQRLEERLAGFPDMKLV